MSYLWVVEIKFDDSDKWEATIGVGLSREDGRAELKDWQKKNKGCKYRLVKYEAKS